MATHTKSARVHKGWAAAELGRGRVVGLGVLSSLLMIITTRKAGIGVAAQGLDPNYYVASCPMVEQIVSGWLTANVFTDPTGPAALIRLLFHDCEVEGCDASVLLDTNPTRGIHSEMLSDTNFGIRDVRFIDSIKMAVEMACPNVVSCADILAMAARDCVSITQGPQITIPLGRKDGFSASNLQADAKLPKTDISVDAMLAEFRQMGMSTDEAVAILGAHTLGVGHCVNVMNRMHPTMDPTLQPIMAAQLAVSCPISNPQFMNNFTAIPNDMTNFLFDNQYFKDILSDRGLFKIDAGLSTHTLTAPAVNRFAANQNEFFSQFASAFVKLSSFGVLTGSQGEVRTNCHMVN